MKEFVDNNGKAYPIDEEGYIEKNGKLWPVELLVRDGKGKVKQQQQPAAPQVEALREIKPPEAITESTAPLIPEPRRDSGKIYDSSVLDLLGFVAPMAVDEFQYHGLDNKGKLAAKIAADAALTLVPVSKPIMLASKAIKPLSKAAKIADAAYGSSSIPKRMGIQAAAGGIDNTIYQGIQDAVEQKEYEPLDYLRASVLGAIGGSTSGAISLGKYRNYSEGDLYKKTKAKTGSAKQELFDLRGRFDDQAQSNAELAAALLTELPFKHGLPMTWLNTGKHLDNEITKYNQLVTDRAAAAKAARKAGAPSNPSAGTADNFMIDKPVFKNKEENAAFGESIRKFLDENNLGTLSAGLAPYAPDDILRKNEQIFKDLKTGELKKFVPNSKIELNPGVTVMDAEAILKSIYTPTFTSRADHDFRESLRKGMRKARGGDSPSPGSYGEAMIKLEKANKDKQILDLAAGGFGFGTPKNGHLTSFNKETRPQMGPYDFFSKINMPIRNSAQAANNVLDYVFSDKPDEVLEGIKQYGLDHPEVQKAFSALSLNAKAAVLSVLESMSVQAKTNKENKKGASK